MKRIGFIIFAVVAIAILTAGFASISVSDIQADDSNSNFNIDLSGVGTNGEETPGQCGMYFRTDTCMLGWSYSTDDPAFLATYGCSQAQGHKVWIGITYAQNVFANGKATGNSNGSVIMCSASQPALPFPACVNTCP